MSASLLHMAKIDVFPGDLYRVTGRGVGVKRAFVWSVDGKNIELYEMVDRCKPRVFIVRLGYLRRTYTLLERNCAMRDKVPS